jgi:aromatic ring-opening dioxygenase catalytic subunit (LigB family)
MPASRREALAALVAAGAAVIACDPRERGAASTRSERPTMPNDARLPTIYLPHGGGPWPWMDMRSMFSDEEKRALVAYLEGLVAGLPRRPRAMVVVSAHWEARVPTVQTHPRPPILYDYYGFPPETYRIPWPAPGDPAVAARVRELLAAAGIASAEDAERGFDHGTFVPLKLSFPEADMPTVQLSLDASLDPRRHLAIGRALRPLRDEGVLLVGSGMSFHDLRAFGMPAEARAARSAPFDAWRRRAVVAAPDARDAELARWSEAPGARMAHPREEHLLPLMVMAGAAGDDVGQVAWNQLWGGVHLTAVHFGA